MSSSLLATRFYIKLTVSHWPHPRIFFNYFHSPPYTYVARTPGLNMPEWKSCSVVMSGLAVGCRNMMFVGDLLQLQPVNGNPVFQNITQKALPSAQTASVNIWRDSVAYDELTINERQKSDAEFTTMLDCVRGDCPTDETISTLHSRESFKLLRLKNSMSCSSWVRHRCVCSRREKCANSSIVKCSIT